MKHVVLVAATTGYQIRMFDEAAKRLGIRLTLATDRCHVLQDPWADRAVAVKFAEGLEAIPACDGMLAVGDLPALLAAQAAERLGIPFHSVDAATICHDKGLTRERMRAAGLPSPDAVRVAIVETKPPLPFPCVLKPLHLSASRGVIRANDFGEYDAARRRIARMVEDEFIQVEAFIPGREYAVEGVMTGGVLQTFCVFEKPDPLDGPYFEESIYLSCDETKPIAPVQLVCGALGLSHGPVHAEVRVNEEGVFVLEVAARPIGGLCAAMLRFSGGVTLEEVLLRHAAGEDVNSFVREPEPAGVMMIPIGRGGVFQDVQGVAEALAVPGVTDCIITAKKGHRIVPLPEGASYLGFLFARGGNPGQALRHAHAKLKFTFTESLSII